MERVEILDLFESEDPDVREFAPKVSSEDGPPNRHFGAEAHFPEVMLPVYEARVALARNGDLGTELFTKLAVATSMWNGCAYCVGAYSSLLSQHLGGDERVRAFQQAVRDDDLDGREGAVLGFARGVLEDPHRITDDDFERLRADHGFTDATFVELIYTVNIVSGYNRLAIAFDLEYDHQYPEEWAREATAPTS